MHLLQFPYRSYVIAAKIPQNSLSKDLYWDILDPYHFIKTVTDPISKEEFLIVGGEDHRTGQPPLKKNCFVELEKWLRVHFPLSREVLYRWSGQIMEPMDGIAYIGKTPFSHPRLFLSCGYSGNGLTHGSVAAMLISDLIVKRKNVWKNTYSPSRLRWRALPVLIKETWLILKAYSRWFKQLDDKKNHQSNTGKVMTKNLKKIAVYKNSRGQINTYSAICPHLGGIVSWNPLEKTWDCPSHGSRFSCEGRLINGPAVKHLTKENI